MVLELAERSDDEGKNSGSWRPRRWEAAAAVAAGARPSAGDGRLRVGNPDRGRTRRYFAGLMAFAAIAWPVLFCRSTSAALSSDQLTIAEWEAIWTRVLERHVDEAGRIDFAGLKGDRSDLDHVVAFITAVDPASAPARLPSLASRLAYDINAYNALAMKGVLDAGVPESFGALGRLWFFSLRGVEIGSRSTSLYNFENDVIRPIGDPRVHFALNCMVVSCPRLPRTAFTAAALDRELDRAARSFIVENRNVRLDPQNRLVYLSAIFDFYTKDFLAQSPSLIAYINRYRGEPVPLDYRVEFFEYDWTINAQTGRARSARP